MKRLFLALLLIALSASISWSAVTFDAVSTSTGSGVTSLTFTHTVTGSNTLLLCGAMWSNDGATVSTTFNSVSMPAVSSPDNATMGGRTVKVFQLIAPSGGAHSVEMTF